MRKLPHHRATWDSLSAADPAPRIILSQTAFQNRLVPADLLTGDPQPEGIELAEAIEVRTGESRLGHVEVFRVEGVGTSIFGRPRLLSVDRHARPAPRTCPYTLKREEPQNWSSSGLIPFLYATYVVGMPSETVHLPLSRSTSTAQHIQELQELLCLG